MAMCKDDAAKLNLTLEEGADVDAFEGGMHERKELNRRDCSGNKSLTIMHSDDFQLIHFQIPRN